MFTRGYQPWLFTTHDSWNDPPSVPSGGKFSFGKTCFEVSHNCFLSEKQIDRQTDRQTDRQIDRFQIYIYRYIYGQIDRWIDRQMDRQINRNIDRWIDRQMDRQIDRQTDRQIDKKIDNVQILYRYCIDIVQILQCIDRYCRQINIQTGRQTDKQTDRQIGRQIDSQIQTERERERERETHSLSHLSIRQWVCSAIHASQQLTSPVGFLSLKLQPPPCVVLLVCSHWGHIISY